MCYPFMATFTSGFYFFSSRAILAAMGRTLPSTTQIVFNLIAELKPFYGALRRSDQLILDNFFEAILQHRVPIGNADSLLPMEMLPFVILLEERKKFDQLHAELIEELEELNEKVNQLLSPPA
jgi:hypothetical protein